MGEFRCIFCQQGGKRSKEHVLRAKFSQLIPAERGLTFTTDSPKAHGGSGFSSVSHRPITAFEMAVNDVCRECNQGWLNDLESSVEDVVVDLATRRRRLVTAAEMPTLATWMTTRALMRTLLDAGSEAPYLVFREVYERRSVPENTIVHWAQRDHEALFTGGKNTHVVIRRRPATAGQHLRITPHHKVNLVTFGIGGLFFQVGLHGGSNDALLMIARTMLAVEQRIPDTFQTYPPIEEHRQPVTRTLGHEDQVGAAEALLRRWQYQPPPQKNR